MQTTLVLFLSLIYAAVTGYCCYRIRQAPLLSKRQKIANAVLCCCIPVIWYRLVRPIIFPKHWLITRQEREKLIRMESGIRQERRNDKGY